MFGFFSSTLGIKLGIPYLFLDPEYLGKNNFLSFFLLGLAFGGFTMTWNITTYILNSFRFPFLATLRRPFTKFCLNNAIIPLFFLAIFCWALIKFQIQNEYHSVSYILVNYLGGFFAGFIIFLVLTFLYFFNTNKDIFRILGIETKSRSKRQLSLEIRMKKFIDWKTVKPEAYVWKVATYLSSPFKVRLTRSTAHYDDKVLFRVFRQNHSNALIIESVALIILLGLGLLIDYSVFRIPAGASIFLLFSILMMLSGALAFWLRGWRTFMFIVLALILNYMIKYEVVDQKNQAYGLNYNTTHTSYTSKDLGDIGSMENYHADRTEMVKTLENWKKRTSPFSKKPKLIFINVSGGGLRSAVWTMNVLQKTDSILGGKLFGHTFLITGASGGMIGAAYFRELYLRKINGESIDIYDDLYINNISKDLLNAIAFTTVVNDLFFPFKKHEIDGNKYLIDRGYAFERQLNENTDFLLDKKISEYFEPEKQGLIPTIVLSPVIVNDGRNMFISAQPVSFLTRPYNKYNIRFISEMDAVEFGRMFKNNNASGLKFTSALRMNATFPYITPYVSLPTEPTISVMDAGMRDNFGVDTAIRMLFVMREWIEQNTSGVIFVQIRDIPKTLSFKGKTRKTAIDNLLNPIGNIYLNLQEFQDYNNDNLVENTRSWFKKPIHIVRFQYISSDEERRASLSWHLTTREKRSILNAYDHALNQRSLKELAELIN